MWVESQEMKNLLLEKYKLEHDYANELYGFSSIDWENSKKYYNQTNYDAIFHVGEPDTYHIKITIDSQKDSREFLQYILHLRDILDSNESGKYEFGGIEIDIKELKAVIPDLKVINPIFESSLLNIE